MIMLQIVHWLASLIVLAEALNKLERTAPAAPGLTPHQRLVDALKALAWSLLAIGAFWSLTAHALLHLGVRPDDYLELMRLERPTLADTAVMAGFATLIIRTRVKEG